MCNKEHIIKDDGAFTVIGMNDRNTDVPYPNRTKKLNSHMIPEMI